MHLYPKKFVRGFLTTIIQGRLSTVNLLVLTSLDQLVFILKIFFYNTSYLNEEVTCTEPSASVSVPWIILQTKCLKVGMP
jgi:hypothetical protein